MGASAAAIGVSLDGHVAVVELQRPPYNYIDAEVVSDLADALEALDENGACRAIVLASQGTAFCAGADFANRKPASPARNATDINPVYRQALRLAGCAKPVVAAVHGSAIGAGLGLALVADFRVACPEARFSANFNRLGIHPGFGLSFTLPRLIGQQHAALMFYTGRRVGGIDAVEMGLADLLVPQERVRHHAMELAREIAASAPLAVQSTRATLRRSLADGMRAAMAHESEQQNPQLASADFREGVAAAAARRVPEFTGR